MLLILSAPQPVAVRRCHSRQGDAITLHPLLSNGHQAPSTYPLPLNLVGGVNSSLCENLVLFRLVEINCGTDRSWGLAQHRFTCLSFMDQPKATEIDMWTLASL